MARRQEERDLLKEFIEKCDLKGRWEIEKPIPSKILLDKLKEKDVYMHSLAAVHNFRIDALCESKEAVWLIEAKLTMKIGRAHV